jgi:hypothetical protein
MSIVTDLALLMVGPGAGSASFVPVGTTILGEGVLPRSRGDSSAPVTG